MLTPLVARLALWPASVVTAEMLMGSQGPSPQAVDLKPSCSLLELGAGLALPSIVAAKFNGLRCVVSSDYPDKFQLENIEHNAALNLGCADAGAGGSVAYHVAGHLWGSDVTGLKSLNGGGGFDWVVLSDLVYKSALHTELLQSASDALHPDGTCIVRYLAPPHA